MSTTAAERREEILRDSQATLRQVESILSGLGSGSGTEDERHEHVERVVGTLEARRAGLKDLVWVLVHTYVEITGLIEALRRSRGLLEQAAMERIQNTHQKLTEVSTATEMATTGMLDGLDRALLLVDGLDAAGGDAPSGADLRERLRDELHAMINLLQFQDITSQQLGYANGVLMDIEERMVALSRVFDLRWLGEEGEGQADGRADPPPFERHTTCDPEASHFDADSRQALADEIFR